MGQGGHGRRAGITRGRGTAAGPCPVPRDGPESPAGRGAGRRDFLLGASPGTDGATPAGTQRGGAGAAGAPRRGGRGAGPRLSDSPEGKQAPRPRRAAGRPPFLQQRHLDTGDFRFQKPAACFLLHHRLPWGGGGGTGLDVSAHRMPAAPGPSPGAATPARPGPPRHSARRRLRCRCLPRGSAGGRCPPGRWPSSSPRPLQAGDSERRRLLRNSRCWFNSSYSRFFFSFFQNNNKKKVSSSNPRRS